MKDFDSLVGRLHRIVNAKVTFLFFSACGAGHRMISVAGDIKIGVDHFFSAPS
jgi:hypothetical protein